MNHINQSITSNPHTAPIRTRARTGTTTDATTTNDGSPTTRRRATTTNATMDARTRAVSSLGDGAVTLSVPDRVPDRARERDARKRRAVRGGGLTSVFADDERADDLRNHLGVV